MLGHWLFWSALGLIAYGYLGFPILVLLRGRLRPRPIAAADYCPPVSVVLSAYNEAASIAGRLDNLLQQDYPPERLEIVVASDGSTDGTEAILRGYERRGLRLLALPRSGKAAALEAAVAASGGEVLVFTDANSQFAPDAIRRLLRPLADPAVGGVAGDQRYRRGAEADAADAAASGEAGYWSFDRLLKDYESRAGSTISATGAIYAIRRELFQGVPVGVTDDFAVSTQVIAEGRRLVFAGDAIAFEPVAAKSGVEFGRKVRIMTRGLRGVWLRRALLNPFRHGFYSLQLFSHKLLRRLMVFPLLVLLLLTPFLWAQGGLHALLALAQLGFYACALVGAVARRRRLGRLKPFALPYYFCLVNAAALVAVANLARGVRIERWEPQRQDGRLSA